MLHAAPRMTAAVPTEVIPKRRGLHQFDGYQVSTSFPFGFISARSTTASTDRLLVYPALGEVDPQAAALCVVGRAERPDDAAAARGASDEFYGVKEFRPGREPAAHLLAAQCADRLDRASWSRRR